MKVSAFVSLFGLIVLLASANLLKCKTATSIESHDNFGVDDLTKIINETSYHTILLVNNGTCSDKCESQQAKVVAKISEIKKADPQARLIRANCSNSTEILDALHLYSESGVFMYFKGEPIRIDNNEYEEEPELDVTSEILKVLQKIPVHLETVADAEKAAKGQSYFAVFYGNKTLEFYQNLEIVAKLSEVHIYET